MSFIEYLTDFAGLPVAHFPADPEDAVPEVAGPVAWRLDCWTMYQYESTFEALFERFLEQVDTTPLTALVIGMWDAEDVMNKNMYPVADLLAAHADRFPNLRSLFLGDIFEGDGGADTAYILHGDVGPILTAYPHLEELWIRGCAGELPDAGLLYFKPLRHDRLRTLVFQSGGLARGVIRSLADCEFPELEHLEIYFGLPHYGGDATLADIDWLLAGGPFPKLRRLGLKDSMQQDEIAAAVAHAPVVAQLEVLDLSLGALGDEGAAALLAGQPLDHLAKLDLQHNYLSGKMAARLRGAWPGVEVDVSERQEADDGDRYIAVAE